MKRNVVRFGLTGAIVVVAATMGLAGDQGGRLHPAEEAGAVVSLNSLFKTQIKFSNETGKTIKIFEMDSNKTRNLKATLKDGKDQKFDTFLTHAFVVTDKDENAIAIYYTDSEPRTVRLKKDDLKDEG